MLNQKNNKTKANIIKTNIINIKHIKNYSQKQLFKKLKDK